MTCFSPLVILWITIFLGLLSADQIIVSGHVGSTAVLPCKLQTVDTETPHIRWFIDTETVFERWGEEVYQDEGYEGRVDVPEEDLSKGNCSLVLKHLKLTDTADYMSYEVVRGTRRLNRVKRSETPELNLISKVHLSVNETPEEDFNVWRTDDAGVTRPGPQIILLSLLACLCPSLLSRSIRSVQV